LNAPVSPAELSTEDFDFDLPPEAIALRPAVPRDSARLLVVDASAPQALSDHTVSDLPRLLREGDLLVFNDTKVLAAQLFGHRERGSEPPVNIGLTLIEPCAGGEWRAFAKPGRRLRVGDMVRLARADAAAQLTITAKEEGGIVIVAPRDPAQSMARIMLDFGVAPLPPYIASKRRADDRDRQDYQTVYAARDGAVAAPTAGLHFTPELFARLGERGIGHVFTTLHVGAGTFLPVKTVRLTDHRMHSEWGEITAETADRINAARATGGRIVSVGTTVLRLLETAAGRDGSIAPFVGETDIFIAPGRQIRSADLLFTNFHLPKSTLFMLVCAFSGTDMMKSAYAHAIRSGYRFYSYGDACLLHLASPAPAAR
jgi:S-adenosylmethionine:tRNA ribosyltransferase-isomerase